MAKHTPGLWEAKPALAPQWTVETKDAFICQTLGGNDEANARLIATSPRLLAVCKAVLPVLQSASTHSHDNAVRFARCIADLQAVIAEAKGTD